VIIATNAPPRCRQILDNPSRAELRKMAGEDETTTEYGSASYVSEHRARSAADTRTTVDGEVTEDDLEMVEEVEAFLEDRELIRVDRTMGRRTGFGSLHCRLYVTRPFARLAHMFDASLEPAGDPGGEPHFTTIDVPEWPHGKSILVDPKSGTTFVLGSDYFGEIKKSFLRQTMYHAKMRGWLGLHAGSKLVRARSARDDQLSEKGFLFFGLSGTGKTSLTCHDFDLDLPDGEHVRVRQDDVVILNDEAYCKGTEGGGFYIKTDALNPRDQRALYDAATSPRAILENVWVEEDGSVDFYDDRITSNGRAIVPIDEVLNTDDDIDVAEITHVFFITRNPLVPAVARLTADQAAVAFMLGESIKTSAADPDAKGEPVRSVGTNPFIMGPKGEEGEIFHEILAGNPQLHCYLLNTGRIGRGDRAEDIGIGDTVAILRALAREQVEWTDDPASGLEIPESIPDVADGKFRLADHFAEAELEDELARLRTERRAWLDRFPKFPEHLEEAVY
jgi:phosphoenolpyruvate carboxykinase (ATP)